MGKFAMSNVFNRYERNRSQRVDVTSPIASKEQFLSTREREERMISRTRFSMLSTVLKFYYDLSNNLYENGIREETVNESQEANLFCFILMNTLWLHTTVRQKQLRHFVIFGGGDGYCTWGEMILIEQEKKRKRILAASDVGVRLEHAFFPSFFLHCSCPNWGIRFHRLLHTLQLRTRQHCKWWRSLRKVGSFLRTAIQRHVKYTIFRRVSFFVADLPKPKGGELQELLVALERALRRWGGWETQS